MNDGIRSSPNAALIEEAKKERQRLVEQIEQSQRTIQHSREIIAHIDEVLAARFTGTPGHYA
jgi:hypothetical protein